MSEKVQRYHHEYVAQGCRHVAVPGGEWVRYSDYAKLEVENEELRGWRAQVTAAVGSGRGGARYGDVADQIKRDRAENERLREALEDMCWQFADRADGDPPKIWTMGLSALEGAFDVLGWTDPKDAPEIRCDEPGCERVRTCGWLSPDGYRNTCYEHWKAIQETE